MTTPHAALEQAFVLGEGMLEAAGRDDWDAFAVAEAERGILCEQQHPDDPRSAELLVQLIEQNRTLEQRVSEAHERIGHELGKNRHGHRAASAYLNLTRD
jgi:hypothetical protein